MTAAQVPPSVDTLVAYVRRRAQVNREDAHRLMRAPGPIDPDYPLDAEYYRMIAVQLDEIALAIELGRIK